MPPQNHGNIVVATPESLQRIGVSEQQDVAALNVVDPECYVHLGRGFTRGNFHVQNDRPQLIANFRHSVELENWLPPLILLTEKPAKSITTDPIARAYCLDAWWFVNGATTRWGPPPASPVATL
jgi:hypothetical protein